MYEISLQIVDIGMIPSVLSLDDGIQILFFFLSVLLMDQFLLKIMLCCSNHRKIKPGLSSPTPFFSSEFSVFASALH